MCCSTSQEPTSLSVHAISFFDSLQIKLQLLTLSRHYQLGTIISEPRALLCSVLNDRLAVLNHEDQKMLKHSTIANVISFHMYSLPSYSFVPFIFYSCRAKKCISFFFHSPQKQPSRGGVLRKRKGIMKICTKFAGEHPCRNAISIKLQSNFIENGVGVLLHIFRTLIPKNTSASVTQPYQHSHHIRRARAQALFLFYFVGCMVTKYTCVWQKFRLNKTTIVTKNEYTYSYYSTAYPEECNLVRFEIGKLMETLLLM